MMVRSQLVRTTAIFSLLYLVSCASLPEERHERYSFPAKNVYPELPTGENLNRPYETLGWVRSRAAYPTMEQMDTNQPLCRNYYNKAAQNLLKEAKKAHGEAVIQVRSVVLLLDGKVEEHVTPECSDDGAEGEVLLRGIAIRYKPMPSPTPTPSSFSIESPMPTATPSVITDGET